MTAKLEIRCMACGLTALVRSEPAYAGFRKTGETFICTACGHRYASRAETPFLDDARVPSVFAEKDKSAPVRLFRDDERRRCCGWCAHFILNPFSNRCGSINREMQATDFCDRFEPKPEARSAIASASPLPPLDKLFGGDSS